MHIGLGSSSPNPQQLVKLLVGAQLQRLSVIISVSSGMYVTKCFDDWDFVFGLTSIINDTVGELLMMPLYSLEFLQYVISITGTRHLRSHLDLSL